MPLAPLADIVICFWPDFLCFNLNIRTQTIEISMGFNTIEIKIIEIVLSESDERKIVALKNVLMSTSVMIFPSILLWALIIQSNTNIKTT